MYLAGLALFFALHVIPYKQSLKQRIVEKLGAGLYKAGFALLSLLAVGLVVAGWYDFDTTYFYEPPKALKHVHMLLMLPAVFLWVAAEMPGNTKRFIKHPMLTGMKLWAVGHLLANGDLRSMLLFGSFLIYSVVAVILTNKRDNTQKQIERKPVKFDVIALVIALVLYVLLMTFHGQLFGMPAVSR